jgi:ApaG protein
LGRFYSYEYEYLFVSIILSRTWHICDALNSKEKVEGDGVVGDQPIIQPNESYIYNSGCTLKSPFGSMKGTYTMVDLSVNETFKANIPTFKLCTEFAQN